MKRRCIDFGDASATADKVVSGIIDSIAANHLTVVSFNALVARLREWSEFGDDPSDPDPEPLRAEQEALARKAAATMFEIIDCASRDVESNDS